MSKRIANSIVKINGVDHLKCDNCGKLLPANREYFRADYGNYHGIRRPCIKCQTEYDRKKWLRYKNVKPKSKEKWLTDEERNRVLERANLPRIDKYQSYPQLVIQVRHLMNNNFIMDAMRINMHFQCGHEVARRVVADIKAGRYVK